MDNFEKTLHTELIELYKQRLEAPEQEQDNLLLQIHGVESDLRAYQRFSSRVNTIKNVLEPRGFEISYSIDKKNAD